MLANIKNKTPNHKLVLSKKNKPAQETPPIQAKNFIKPFLLPLESAIADSNGESNAMNKNEIESEYEYSAVFLKSLPKKCTISLPPLLVTAIK